jgi:hypothetical protein
MRADPVCADFDVRIVDVDQQRSTTQLGCAPGETERLLQRLHRNQQISTTCELSEGNLRWPICVEPYTYLSEVR